ncbi:uncharacterized protein LOC107046795 isoform X2 [Diachasma alloeum]|nr:uncharacterized protein LOC107046795 isoform X2 [Diachasma alloeum]
MKCDAQGCPGEGKRKRGRIVVTHGHNHVGRFQLRFKVQFKISLIRKSVNCWSNPRKIHNDIIADHPRAEPMVSYGQYSKSIRHWKNNHMYLPALNSFGDCEQVVNERATLKEYDGGVLEVQAVPLQDGSEIGLNGNRIIPQMFDGHQVRLRIEMSSDVKPTQLHIECTVVFLIVFRHSVVPCLLGFLPNTADETFNTLVGVVNEQFFRGVIISSILTPLDQGLFQAVEQVFPGIPREISLIDRIKEIVMAANTLHINLQPQDTQILLSKLISVSLAHDVRQAFTDPAGIVAPQQLDILNGLFQYYEDSWLNGVTLPIYGFYEKPQSLLLPDTTIWYKLTRIMKGNIDGIWDWMKGMINLQEKSHREVTRGETTHS